MANPTCKYQVTMSASFHFNGQCVRSCLMYVKKKHAHTGHLLSTSPLHRVGQNLISAPYTTYVW